MSKDKLENPVAVGRVKVQGVLYREGETVPADKVDPDRLTRLVAKGLLSYGGTPEPVAAPAAKEALEDRAEGKAGRPDLKLPDEKDPGAKGSGEKDTA